MDEETITVTAVHDGLPPTQRAIAMLAVGIAVSISVLVGSIANIALPTIARDMNVTPAESIWVVNAYQLAVTVCLMPCASLGDVYGHRRVYIWGLVFYTLGSLICALAPDMPTLIAARVLQGIGGAGIMSVNGALVRFIFPRAQLGRGVGYNVLVVAASSAAGPSVAAAIMAFGSWPWLFAVQVPFGAVSWWLSLRYLPRSPPSGHKFDPVSALLNAVALGTFIPGLDGIGRGQSATMILLELAIGIVVGTIFLRRQLTLRAPMLPVDLFRRPVFALSVATAVCVHGAAMITLITLPFYFQYVDGLSPIEIGMLITPWPAVLVIIAPIAGRLADRYPAGLLGGLGLAVMTVGLLLVLFLPEHASKLDIAWRMAVCGTGFGFFQSPNNRLLIGSAPPDRAGAGSGMVSTARLVGQTTGSALVAVVLGLTHNAAHPVVLGTHMAIGVAAGLAALGTVLSWARLANR
ncbi:MAG TPA: MFS transporter [Acetobacteraceae bacterium]|jgi:DHA2 family multidrug resistance protein-like MFS transporter|nr:MFS transporter [Acetobacteraceae bacterium]